MIIKTLSIAFIVTLVACGRKKASPFCFLCEKGKLYYSQGFGCPKFVKENGDSLYFMDDFSQKLRKDGIPVCVSYRKYDRADVCLVSPLYKVTCIKID